MSEPSIDGAVRPNLLVACVGTATEVYTYLRVLYARLGHRLCPHCGKEVLPAFDPANVSREQVGPAAPNRTFEPTAKLLRPRTEPHCVHIRGVD